MLRQYDIEFVKLKAGTHEFRYQLDDAFFKEKEASLYERGQIDVLLTFRKSETLFDLHFEMEGYVWTECDRCTDPIEVPVKASTELRIKINAEKAGTQEIDLWYIHPNDHKINLYDFLYDSICVHVPLRKVCSEAVRPKSCNQEYEARLVAEEENNPQDSVDPRWLKLNELLKK